MATQVVYMLYCSDIKAFKIGKTADLTRRIYELENTNDIAFDLDKSWYANADSDAKWIERVLLVSLAPYRIRPPSKVSGHTEWFAERGRNAAMRMLLNIMETHDLDFTVKENIFMMVYCDLKLRFPNHKYL